MPDRTVGFQNLQTLWQNALERLHPPAAQAPLRQHGQLLAYCDASVEIGLRSPALVKRAQGYTEQIVLAFKQVLGSKVKVSITLTGANESKTIGYLGQQAANVARDRDEVMDAAQSLAAYFEGVLVP